MSALPQSQYSPRPTRTSNRHRPPPPLRLVPPRPKASWVGVMLALVIAGVLVVVALQAQAAGAAFEARALEREVVELQRRHEQLIAEVAQLEAPDRLRRIAVNELGMVAPTDTAYLDLRSATKFAAADSAEVADPVKRARAGR